DQRIVGYDVKIQRSLQARWCAGAARTRLEELRRERTSTGDQLVQRDILRIRRASNFEISAQHLKPSIALQREIGIHNRLRVARIFAGALVRWDLEPPPVRHQSCKCRTATDGNAATTGRGRGEALHKRLIRREADHAIAMRCRNREVDYPNANVLEVHQPRQLGRLQRPGYRRLKLSGSGRVDDRCERRKQTKVHFAVDRQGAAAIALSIKSSFESHARPFPGEHRVIECHSFRTTPDHKVALICDRVFPAFTDRSAYLELLEGRHYLYFVRPLKWAGHLYRACRPP